VALGTALRGARGRVVSSDQKLWIPHTWLLHPYRAGETLQLRGPDLALPVDELYRMAFDDGAA